MHIYKSLDTTQDILVRRECAAAMNWIFEDHPYLYDLKKRLTQHASVHATWLAELNNKTLVLK